MQEINPASYLPHWHADPHGRLAESLYAYFRYATTISNTAPTEGQIELIRSYLQVWSDFPWDKDEAELNRLRVLVREIREARDINHWCDQALRLGIDPF